MDSGHDWNTKIWDIHDTLMYAIAMGENFRPMNLDDKPMMPLKTSRDNPFDPYGTGGLANSCCELLGEEVRQQTHQEWEKSGAAPRIRTFTGWWFGGFHGGL